MLTFTNRSVITARSGGGRLWVDLNWPGIQLDVKPGRLPDGKDLLETLETEGLPGLPDDLWLTPFNSGKTGDLLWPGFNYIIASTPFIEALKSYGITNFTHRPLEIRRKRSPNINGYHLLLIDKDPTTDDHELRPHPYFRRTVWSLDITNSLLAHLKSNGVTDYETRNAQEAWDSMLRHA